MGAAPKHADRRAGGRTDTTKIVSTLCDYANVSTKKNAVITNVERIPECFRVERFSALSVE